MAVKASSDSLMTREPLWLSCFLITRVAIPPEGTCCPALVQGNVGSIWSIVVFLSWGLRGMARFLSARGFGTRCSFSLKGLSCAFFTWPSVFVLKGLDRLSLPTAVPFCHSHLLSRCPSSGSHRLSFPTAGANQTGVSGYLLAFLSCVPNTVSSM